MSTAASMASLHDRCFDVPPPWSEDSFETLLSHPHCFATIDPGGFVLGRAVAGEAELLTIAVAPEARRCGLGRQLLGAFEAEARARGAVDAFLEVSAENDAAQALYASAGYTERGLRPRYYTAPDGRRIDALVLGRTL